MFNGDIKREALKKHRDAQEEHISVLEDIKKKSLKLFLLRQGSSEFILRNVEGYINKLLNSPKAFEKYFFEYKDRSKEFLSIPDNEFQSNDNQIISELDLKSNAGKVAGVGAAAGVGVAALGPTAAMAIATTFGTASTGTAIASLSGVAATNAAAAWLGGGAIAAGGGGMAGGGTFLAAMGPIGWTIGGVALIFSGVSARNKNLDIANKADIERDEIKKITLEFKKKCTEIDRLISLTEVHFNCQKIILDILIKFSFNNYLNFTDEDRDNLKLMGFHIQLLSKLLGKTVSDLPRNEKLCNMNYVS